MKICVLLSSYEGTGSSFKDYDSYQNPGIYVKSHQFEQCVVTKGNAKQKIDEIVQKDFDYIWNFMWGPANENIAGVDEIKYLESKKFPMIGTSSKFLSLTKLDYKKAIASANLKTPKGITIKGDEESLAHLDLNDLKFPLILKPSVGCGSEHMTKESVCHNFSQLIEQIKLLKSKVHVNYEIIIEEFIEGDEVACMVLETNDGVIALEPLFYVFPEEWPSTEKFLDFDLKFAGIERGLVTYQKFDEDSPVKQKVQETAIRAYQELGVLGSGYARVDFRLKGSELYVLEINPCPAFFAELGNTFGDDFIIQTTFPGGHESLVETIISSKVRFDSILREYDVFASKYDHEYESLAKGLIGCWSDLVERFDYSGDVLDLGCGTGFLGNVIQRKYNAKMTGIDLSSGMVKLVQNYEKVYIGFMENVVLELESTYAHVVSSGALTFVEKRYFEKIFSQMFRLATKSISLAVDNITEEYKSSCAKDYTATLFNHLDTIEKFQIPPDWSLVFKKREYFWHSPRTGMKVDGLVLRYEKNVCDDTLKQSIENA